MIIKAVKLDALKLDPTNAREHSVENVAAIANSLKTFGQQKPIVVWQGFIIAGNGTYEAAKTLGWEKIAVTYAPPEWSSEQARAYALADNQTATLAEWNESLLWEQLVDLDAMGWEMTEFGFDSVAFNGITENELHGEAAFDFEVRVRFRDESDVDNFFATIKRKKDKQLWWPE